MVKLLGEVRTKLNLREYSLIKKTRIIFFADRLAHVRTLMLGVNPIDIY